MKQQKTFYVIYQITNNLNGKIYIGKHKTNNLDDDYMGSGKCLHNAFKKYGLENFTKTILFYLQNEDEMNHLEKMVVIKEFCERDDTYNLNVGGDGGWGYVKSLGLYLKGAKTTSEKFKDKNSQFYRDFSEQQSKIAKDTYWSMPNEKRKEISSKISDKVTAYYETHDNPMKGHTHTQKARKKISDAVSGNKNGSFGKHWIHHDEFKLSISVSDALYWDYIAEGWMNGRVMNFDKVKKLQKTSRNIKKTQIIAKLSKEQKKLLKQDKMYKWLKPMLEVYEKFGFDAVVKEFNYKYTRNNLVQQFKAYIPEYQPNKHTNNTKAKRYLKLHADAVWTGEHQQEAHNLLDPDGSIPEPLPLDR